MSPLLPQPANTGDNTQGMDDRSVIPAGEYLAHIVKTEFKPTKAKTGHFLAIQYKVLEGDHKGRVVFSNLNLDNPNPVAVEIANKELNSLCAACGLEGVEDSDELLQIPFLLTVKVKPADAQWPEGNEVAGYASADEHKDTPAIDEAPETKDKPKAKLPWE